MKYVHLMIACLIVNMGIYILHSANVATGGTVGLALSINYWITLGFAITYLLVNIPFMILAYKKLGKEFTISTVISICMLTGISFLTGLIPTISIPAWIGVVLGSAFAGIGMTYLFLKNSSLGGTSILAVFLQKKYNWDPGKTLFVLDIFILLTTVYSIGWSGLLYSALSAFIVSSIVSISRKQISAKLTDNHEDDSILEDESSEMLIMQ
ncbi:YitT family protein [Ureibacillus chungkukjangi]|uniref:Putative 5xTM membrane YitT family protein n=1 Tax=Ureibacillus chungkukjangi TaxID=1202712 RepID=A0A318TJR1_9BACL|nr:YitT family protein [Ureibacillus chungkukjangi]PYF04673.1 putative 5xTM membrane YitT family protein [Ureibacillus chungkukjangi]